MTCNPTQPSPFQLAMNPMLFTTWMVEQQLQAIRIMTDLMFQANPWMVWVRAGTIDPVTRDSALAAGDETEDIDLEAGGAAAEVVAPQPARAAKAAPARPRAAAPARKPSAAAAPVPSESRARRKPSAPPAMPGGSAAESGE